MNEYRTHEIISDRLILRELTPSFYNHVMNNFTDDEIREFFGFSSDEEVEAEKVRHQLGMTMSGKSFLYFHLIEKESGAVIGWCGYHTWFTHHYRAEIGYVMNHDKYKGKGYMKEAMPHVLRHGFDSMNLHRIEALISPDNYPSLKLVKRYGFTQEGTLREHYMKNGKLEDSVIFSLLRKEWEKLRVL